MALSGGKDPPPQQWAEVHAAGLAPDRVSVESVSFFLEM